MTTSQTSILIDMIAAELRPLLVDDAAEALAIQIVGAIQSRYMLIGLPEDELETATAIWRKGHRS